MLKFSYFQGEYQAAIQLVDAASGEVIVCLNASGELVNK